MTAITALRDEADALATLAAEQQGRIVALVDARIARAARNYVRWRDLPRLVRTVPDELGDHSRATTERLIARLDAHIRCGQENIRQGRWTASSATVEALRIARAGEELALACMEEYRDAAE